MDIVKADEQTLSKRTNPTLSKPSKHHITWDDNCKKEYILHAFDNIVVCALLELSENNQDVVSLILNYLPDEVVRAAKRRINRSICHPKDVWAYWRLENVRQDIFGRFISKAEYTVQKHSRKFVIGWFRLLIKLEQSAPARSIFDLIVELIKRKDNKLIVVTDSFITVDDKVFDIDFPRSISLFV